MSGEVPSLVHLTLNELSRSFSQIVLHDYWRSTEAVYAPHLTCDMLAVHQRFVLLLSWLMS
jgi:hypothetical protein